jgi:peptidoglycan/xylan/chitin deacetylase (PgdA/CDA1 family)
VLRILTYHRVAELQDTNCVDPRSVSATPSVFLSQMRHVADHYRPVSVTEVLDSIESGARLDERSVLITFDDAYADFLDFAWPILKQLRLPVTIFVPTAYPDHPEMPFWWDKLYHAFSSTTRRELVDTPLGALSLANQVERRRGLRMLQGYAKTMVTAEAQEMVDSICRQLVGESICTSSVLSWDQLRALSKEGVTIGSHSRTHPLLDRLSAGEIRDEVRGSQMDLKREIGFSLPIFCYPNGDYNRAVVAILKKEGIVLGFTTIAGGNDLGSEDLLALKRIDITPRTSAPIFRIRVLRVAMALDGWRCRRRRTTSSRRRSWFGVSKEARQQTVIS